MKLRIADTKVTLTNLTVGSSYWVFDIGLFSYRLEALEDNDWKLSRSIGSGEFEQLEIFRAKSNYKAFQKGLEQAFIYSGALA
jgi:hypothetical protein